MAGEILIILSKVILKMTSGQSKSDASVLSSTIAFAVYGIVLGWAVSQVSRKLLAMTSISSNEQTSD